MVLTETSQPYVVITLAAIAAVVSIITAVLGYLTNRNSRVNTVKIAEVKTTVDGKMSELLEASKRADNLEGAERERVEQRARENNEPTERV